MSNRHNQADIHVLISCRQRRRRWARPWFRALAGRQRALAHVVPASCQEGAPSCRAWRTRSLEAVEPRDGGRSSRRARLVLAEREALVSSGPYHRDALPLSPPGAAPLVAGGRAPAPGRRNSAAPRGPGGPASPCGRWPQSGGRSRIRRSGAFRRYRDPEAVADGRAGRQVATCRPSVPTRAPRVPGVAAAGDELPAPTRIQHAATCRTSISAMTPNLHNLTYTTSSRRVPLEPHTFVGENSSPKQLGVVS